MHDFFVYSEPYARADHTHGNCSAHRRARRLALLTFSAGVRCTSVETGNAGSQFRVRRAYTLNYNARLRSAVGSRHSNCMTVLRSKPFGRTNESASFSSSSLPLRFLFCCKLQAFRMSRFEKCSIIQVFFSPVGKNVLLLTPLLDE